MNLFDIAFLNYNPLQFALEKLNIGLKDIDELKDYMNNYYVDKTDSFIVKNENEAEFIIKFPNNTEVIAKFIPNKNVHKKEEQVWALVNIKGKSKNKDLLFEFADFYGFNPSFNKGTDKLENLVNMALEEDWGKNNIALVKYIVHTYHYLYHNEPDKIIKGIKGGNSEYAIFNTGLVDRASWSDIYALFERNRTRKKPEYAFKNFCVKGNGDGKIISEYFEKLPEKANYFTRENASDILIFDSEKELHPDFEHIVFDGLKRNRFPQWFLDENGISKGDIKSREMSNPNILKVLEKLKSSIEYAQRRVSQNYKIALPMYYPTKNKMSFLLPITLTDDLKSGKADLALVVSLAPSKRYIGQTILTLPMAYSNSRLICKPSNEWLEINSDSEILDTDEDDYE